MRERQAHLDYVRYGGLKKGILVLAMDVFVSVGGVGKSKKGQTCQRVSNEVSSQACSQMGLTELILSANHWA